MQVKESFIPMKFKGIKIKVHVLIYGNKNAKKHALCLHGFASSGKVGYENLAKYLKNYNLVAIDL